MLKSLARDLIKLGEAAAREMSIKR